MNNTHSYRAVLVLIALAFCASARAQFGVELVPPAEATHHSVKSGDWTDPATWDCGVPGNGAKVLIDRPVKLHVATADLNWIHITDTGRLPVCDHCDTKISARTIYVSMMGGLQLGTPATPVTATATLEFLPGSFGANDFRQAGGGLICHGEFYACGTEITPWCTARVTAEVGATTILLDQVPYNWKAGQTILIAGTDGMLGENMSLTHRYQSEYKTIVSVAGRTVTFSPPLTYRKFQWRADLPYHVAHLTRNVTIKSRSTSTNGDRGHLMFHSSKNYMQYMQALDLGRTIKANPVTDPRIDQSTQDWVVGSNANPRGRYADHNHKCGPLASQSRRIGCVYRGSPGWLLVNHTSNCVWQECIALDSHGAGFITEEGQERGHMHRCLAAMNRGLGDNPLLGSDDDHGISEIGDWGKDGAGFWLESGLVDVTECVSFDNSGRGFALRNRTFNNYGNYPPGTADWIKYPVIHPASLLTPEYLTVPNADSPNAISHSVPQRLFDRNTAYNNRLAFQGWSGAPFNSGSQKIWPDGVRASITNFTAWGRGGKFHSEYFGRQNVTGLTIVGDNAFRPTYESLCKQSQAVLLRSPEVTIRDWEIVGVQDNMFEFTVEGAHDPGGIAGKNIVIQGKQINADGSVN